MREKHLDACRGGLCLTAWPHTYTWMDQASAIDKALVQAGVRLASVGTIPNIWATVSRLEQLMADYKSNRPYANKMMCDLSRYCFRSLRFLRDVGVLHTAGIVVGKLPLPSDILELILNAILTEHGIPPNFMERWRAPDPQVPYRRTLMGPPHEQYVAYPSWSRKTRDWALIHERRTGRATHPRTWTRRKYLLCSLTCSGHLAKDFDDDATLDSESLDRLLNGGSSFGACMFQWPH